MPLSLAAPVEAWLSRVSQSATAAAQIPDRPEEYPQNIKDRLLYVLEPTGVQFRVDIYKGRMAAAVDTLNKSMRRYDVLSAIRGNAVPGFIRPGPSRIDPALAQTRIAGTRAMAMAMRMVLPDLLLPKGRAGG